jgi:hypothetical protein
VVNLDNLKVTRPLRLVPLPHSLTMIQDDIPAGSIILQGCSTSHLVRYLQFTSVLQLLTPRVGLTLSFAIILAVHFSRSPWRKGFPGPKGLPILGNILELKNKGWLFEKDCERMIREFIFVSAGHCEPRALSKTSQSIRCISIPLGSLFSY